MGKNKCNVMPAPGYAKASPGLGELVRRSSKSVGGKAGIHAFFGSLKSWIPACAGMTVFLVAAAAQAGDVNISNGRGMWQSTMCQRPVPPAYVGISKDAPADTLNAATASYNMFVKQTQDYMACLSSEARADNDASASLINATVERQMQDAQSDVDRAHAQLFGPAK